MIMTLASRFLASKWVTVVLIAVCAAGTAYVTYIIGENRILGIQNTTLKNSKELYKNEVTRLNDQIQLLAKAEEAAKKKLSDNQVALQELTDEEKIALSNTLPVPLVERMCELGQIDGENCS